MVDVKNCKSIHDCEENDQQEENDQFTNNQFNKEKDRMDCLYRSLFSYWLLSVSLVIGIWSLVIIFYFDILHFPCYKASS